MLSPTHVQITVHRATNLRQIGKAGTNDAYALVELGSESYKTSVKERCVEPVWNEEYISPVSAELRSSDVIRVSVYHRRLMGFDEMLGQTEIPLYKVQMHDRARIRRYALYDKLPTRASFGKGSRLGSKSPRSSMRLDSESPATSPVSDSLTSIAENYRGEIELTIVIQMDSLTASQKSILRPRSTNVISDGSSNHSTRRYSMPTSMLSLAPTPDDATEDTSKKRRSLLSFPDGSHSGSSIKSRSSTSDSGSHLQVVNEGKESDKRSDIRVSRSEDDLKGDSVREEGNADDQRQSIDGSNPAKVKISIGDTPFQPGNFKESQSELQPESSCNSSISLDVEEQSEEEWKGNETSSRGRVAITNKRLANDLKPVSFLDVNSIQKINKYQPSSTEIGLFGGYDREDLISTVIRQHARLSLAEAYIGDLEHYVDTLVLRVLDSHPRLLHNPYIRQRSPSTSNDRGVASRTARRAAKTKVGRR